jgi:hypothetical protein
MNDLCLLIAQSLNATWESRRLSGLVRSAGMIGPVTATVLERAGDMRSSIETRDSCRY